MVYELLSVTGALFYVALAIMAIIITAQVADESPGYALTALIVSVAVLLAFSDAPILPWIKANPWLIIYGVLGYLAVSAIWGFIKWRAFFLPKQFERYENYRKEFLKQKGWDAVPADAQGREELRRYVEGDKYFRINEVRQVGNNKKRITTWMAYWPFSIVATFFGDFAHRLFSTIYQTMAGVLQKSSDRMSQRYTELN